MTLVIENASENFAKAIKSMAKLDNAIIKESKEPSKMLKKAIKEYKKDKKAGKLKTYANFDEFLKEIDK